MSAASDVSLNPIACLIMLDRWNIATDTCVRSATPLTYDIRETWFSVRIYLPGNKGLFIRDPLPRESTEMCLTFKSLFCAFYWEEKYKVGVLM